MAETLDEFFSINTTDDWFGISKANADKLVEQYQAGNSLLKIDDIYGSPHIIPAQHFLGMHWSTPEYRATVREHNKLMKQERGESWEA